MQVQIPLPKQGAIQGATMLPTFPVPPVSQPEMTGYFMRSYERWNIQASPQIHQGATKIRTEPIPPVSKPEFSYYWRDVNRILAGAGPTIQFAGATKQQTYIFPPNQ